MFSLKKKINFYDCDPAGILFYAGIYEFCHSAYEALVESLNLSFDYWMNDKYVVPIIKSSAEYLLPLTSGDEVNIKISVSVLKDSSFELSYECMNQKNQICAKVKTVHVWLDKSSWKKNDLPDDVKSGLQKYQA